MRYCSANAQMAYEQSRRDDLIAICYVLIYFANNGELPWSDYITNHKLAVRMKNDLDIDELLQNRADQVKELYKEVMNMKFEDKPNYNKLKQIFLQYLQSLNNREPLDIRHDWLTQKETLLN